MKRALVVAIAAGLTVALTAGADAAPRKKYPKRYAGYTATAESSNSRYPSATARQRQNSRAFDRGEYYESISNEHAFGSRSWWLLKERELGGGRP